MAMTKILYVEDNEDNVYMLVNRRGVTAHRELRWRATTPPRSS
jgi:CheY-like chemotaxis protein